MTSANHPVSKYRSTGKVMTVQGTIEPALAGVTLISEQLLADGRYLLRSPERVTEVALSKQRLSLSNRANIAYNWAANEDNLLLDNEDAAAGEALDFYCSGGSTVMEPTVPSLGRDPAGLLRISRKTNLNIVMGCGFGPESLEKEPFVSMASEDMAACMIKDIEDGANGTNIRAGVIGEIVCSDPITEAEKRGLMAAALAQQRTGASIALGANSGGRPDTKNLEILKAAGVPLNKIALMHVERLIDSPSIINKWADSGVYLSIGSWGDEASYDTFYNFPTPSDQQRIELLTGLISSKFQGRLLLGHNMMSKHRMSWWGGHGMSHVVNRILPRIRNAGVSEEIVRMITVDNPTRFLTFD